MVGVERFKSLAAQQARSAEEHDCLCISELQGKNKAPACARALLNRVSEVVD